MKKICVISLITVWVLFLALGGLDHMLRVVIPLSHNQVQSILLYSGEGLNFELEVARPDNALHGSADAEVWITPASGFSLVGEGWTYTGTTHFALNPATEYACWARVKVREGEVLTFSVVHTGGSSIDAKVLPYIYPR